MTKNALPAVLIAALLTLVSYLAFGDVNLNVVDEGYLWYGVQRVRAGEVPLRDFQAYDPARYYWCAAWSFVFGDGILGVRKAAAIFQGLGLACGLLAARRVVRSPWWLLPIGLVLIGWMFPRHKYFEPASAMMAVYAGVLLLESPTRRRHFWIGVFVGVMAIFGRNLAAYSFAGVLGMIALLAWRVERESWLRKLVAYGLGVLVGYAPLLLMLVVVPGFAAGFLESNLIQAKLGSNLPVPWPWPWSQDYGGLGWSELLSQVGIAFSFLLPLVVLPLAILQGLRARGEEVRTRALSISGAFLGVFFLYHASVRSDPAHLAQCIHPTLLALFGLPLALKWRGSLAVNLGAWMLFGVLSFFALLYANYMFEQRIRQTTLVELDVAGEELQINENLALILRRTQGVVEKHVDEEVMFIAPSRPGFYPLMRKRSPTWWLYFVLPAADDEIQEEIMADLADVNYALIIDVPVAGRKDLFLRNSNPRVWEYLLNEYRRIPTPELPREYVLFRRR